MSILIAAEWNEHYPIGTPVLAFPASRDDRALRTPTRTPAWTLGHGAPIVSVEGYAGGIVLRHIDVLPADLTSEGDERLLTADTAPAVDAGLDSHDTFAKAYTRYVDGKLTTVGWRIGEKPGHLVAYFGDTIVRRLDGSYCLRLVVPQQPKAVAR